MLILVGFFMMVLFFVACTKQQDSSPAEVQGEFGDVTPGYNNKIPESIMIPNKVETRIGAFEFFDGLPSAETTQKVYDNLDFLRRLETFLDGIPATPIEGLRLKISS